MIDPEIGFTSDVIRDPRRFVGRQDLIEKCIRSINSNGGLVAVYGKRGVGKSSLLRQVQQIALGDYTLASSSGLDSIVPKRPRKFLTVYYQCDSMIKGAEDLLSRLCNDQNDEDGLLRLVPDDGKELVEFTRSKEVGGGTDLKVVQWGVKGVESSKYAKTVSGNITQTFRNYLNAIVTHQVKKKMNRHGLLILLDEFDTISDKSNIGSLIKSLSSETIRFGICGIGRDISDIVEDHNSVERMLEQGSIIVNPMGLDQSHGILDRAEELFGGKIVFSNEVKEKIVEFSDGYPYFIQLFGKECVITANSLDVKQVDLPILEKVFQRVRSGHAFPTLESAYQRAIGDSSDRQILLHLLAEQDEEKTFFSEDVGRVYLKNVRGDAEGFEVKYLDQILPRLVDKKFGPILLKVGEKQGVYEFNNPVFRLYCRLRNI